MNHFRKRDGPYRLGQSRRPWNSEMDTSSNNEEHCNDARPPHRGRPPGLRGKAIGLYYRDLQRNKKQVEKPKPVVGKLSLTPKQMEDIKKLLASVMPSESAVGQEGCSKWPPIKNETVTEYFESKYSHVLDSDFKQKFMQSITGSMEENLKKSLKCNAYLLPDPHLDLKLKEELQEKQENNEKYKSMLVFRKKLPAFDKREEIIDIIEKNQVVLISGETGCGKTTQLAQFILDHYILSGRGSVCRIVNTQPRRISAISVAHRVAEERGDKCGGSKSSSGYQIRLEKALPRQKGSILFCTTGVLLQWMQSDPALLEVSHLILDEIHERDTVCDFLLTILKEVIVKRPDLKVILMSATLNAEEFSKYFDNCPTLNIPGFTYPVEEFYLEDVLQLTSFRYSKPKKQYYKHMKKKCDNFYADFMEPHIRKLAHSGKYSPSVIQDLQNPDIEDLNIELISALLKHICYSKPQGAVLVFLPGWSDISSLHKDLQQSGFFPSDKFRIIPLHSLMPTAVQKSIFERPPEGIRKIVISTNIAETSITIDDVVYVIDCGKIKMHNYDVENNLSTLKAEWVSLANARQRRGRAGRVQPGICYHLYVKAREMALDLYPLPEMLRTRLEEVILQGKILQLGDIKSFLARVMSPPDSKSIDISLKLLYTMGALDDNENLTPLGYHLAKLPLDPQTGKMILMGAIFGCVDPILSVAASLSFKDAFVIPLGKDAEVIRKKKDLAKGTRSDHLVLAEALRRWEKAGSNRNSFCWDYYLNSGTLSLLSDMKKQFGEYLCEMNFLKRSNPRDQEANINSTNVNLLKAVICSGLYPNVAVVRNVKHRNRTVQVRVQIETPEDGRVVLHPKSVNEQESHFESPILMYYLKLRSSAIYLHDTTMVYPLSLVFFGQNIVYAEDDKGEETGIMSVGDGLKFHCSPETATVIQDLRNRLEQLLAHKVSHPGSADWSPNSSEGLVLRAIAELITTENDCSVQGYY